MDPRFLFNLFSLIISPQIYYLLIINILNVPGMNNTESESPTLSSLQASNCKFCCVFLHHPFCTCVKNLRMKYLIPKTCITCVSYEAEFTCMNPFYNLRNSISVSNSNLCACSRCSCVTLGVFDLYRNGFLPFVFYLLFFN